MIAGKSTVYIPMPHITLHIKHIKVQSTYLFGRKAFSCIDYIKCISKDFLDWNTTILKAFEAW